MLCDDCVKMVEMYLCWYVTKKVKPPTFPECKKNENYIAFHVPLQYRSYEKCNPKEFYENLINILINTEDKIKNRTEDQKLIENEFTWIKFLIDQGFDIKTSSSIMSHVYEKEISLCRSIQNHIDK